MRMNTNLTYFFVRSAKKHNMLFGVPQNFGNQFVCHEMKRVERHWAREVGGSCFRKGPRSRVGESKDVGRYS